MGATVGEYLDYQIRKMPSASPADLDAAAMRLPWVPGLVDAAKQMADFHNGPTAAKHHDVFAILMMRIENALSAVPVAK